jgi:hypothetical protein
VVLGADEPMPRATGSEVPWNQSASFDGVESVLFSFVGLIFRDGIKDHLSLVGDCLGESGGE